MQLHKNLDSLFLFLSQSTAQVLPLTRKLFLTSPHWCCRLSQAYTWPLHFPQVVKLLFMHLNILLDHELLKVSFPSLCSLTCGWFSGGNHCVQRNDAEKHYWDLAVGDISVYFPLCPWISFVLQSHCYWRFLKHAILDFSKWCTPCLECLSLTFFFFPSKLLPFLKN